MKVTVVLSVLTLTAIAAAAQTGPTRYLEPAAMTPVPREENKPVEVQPFQLRGGGSTSAKIVDSQGKTVLDASPRNTIVHCSVSPSGNRLLVYYGNSDYEVFEPATKRRTVLPKQPSGDNKIAFSAWHWINDNTILGESGDELAFKKDAPGEDTMEIQGRLYLYTISDERLAELHLPEGLGAKRFAVTEVNPIGRVHLVNPGSNSTETKDLGWFEVR